jgi:hypothetical protein
MIKNSIRKTSFSLSILIFCALLLLGILGSVYSVQANGRSSPSPNDWHTTTGPVPPENVGESLIIAQSEAVLLNVPSYVWRHGCVPTSAGMLLGYWDEQGFENLIAGDASTQTSAVNETIASTEHYNDYSLPNDSSTPNILPDKSENPVGDEHTNNSLGDYIYTSFSIYDLRYGWSYFSPVPDALKAYISSVEPAYYTNSTNVYGIPAWEDYKAEIDAGRPVLLGVDTTGSGQSDHMIIGIGYSDERSGYTGTPMYASYDTWGHTVRWQEYAPVASGQAWGIAAATYFSISSFADTTSDYWAWKYIESIYNAGITKGCGGGNYCPSASVTRAQMAVFLLKAKHGDSYTPPAAIGVFGDVLTNYWAAAWIEQLATEGITGGCGGGNYCPDSPVNRDQMAVFLLKAKYGNTYSPPDAAGNFGDVSPEYWAADWIEQLAAEGITGGCGGDNYCPASAVNRDQMAVFLVKTFGLSILP